MKKYPLLALTAVLMLAGCATTSGPGTSGDAAAGARVGEAKLPSVIPTGPLSATDPMSVRRNLVLRWVHPANALPPTDLSAGLIDIGREPDNHVVIAQASASRHHARIVVSNGEATLEDLGSKNGTFVAHKRITSTRLSDGDELRLGSVTLTFRIEPPQGPTDTV